MRLEFPCYAFDQETLTLPKEMGLTVAMVEAAEEGRPARRAAPSRKGMKSSVAS